MIFDPFDVAVVQFPFTDIPAAKMRPALILTYHESYNQRTGAAIVAMISAPLQSSWPDDVPISDPIMAGLHKASLVRMKIMTVDLARFQRKLGALSKADRESVTNAIRSAFAGVL